MTAFFLLTILIYSLALLAMLFYVDLKTWLLPNIYVLQFFLSGIAFHLISPAYITDPYDLLIGVFSGGGLLFLIRLAGNKYYGKDTLGMGDVKLIGAAGVWLGSMYIFLAISLGAFAGVIHGLGSALYLRLKTGKAPSLHNLAIPAGPGFIIGIVLCVFLKYYDFIQTLF